jgi:hypothetical protein
MSENNSSQNLNQENLNETQEVTQLPINGNSLIKKYRTRLIIILIFLIIITFGTVCILAYQNYLLKNQIQLERDTSATAETSPTPTAETSPTPTAETSPTPTLIEEEKNIPIYKLISDEDEQQALKEAIATYYNSYANDQTESKDIAIGYPFVKFKDWYYLNAAFIDSPSGVSAYIKKDKNELKVFYLGQECPPENLVTEYSESDKIPIDSLNFRCSPYYTISPK